MTAVNVVCLGDTAHIFTDGAAIDKTGRISGMPAKTYPLPHISAAIAIRGASISLPLLANAIGFRNIQFEELKKGRISDVFRGVLSEYKDVLDLAPNKSAIELVVAGSANGRGSAFAVSSIERPGIAAFTVQEVKELLLGPDVVDDTIIPHKMLLAHCPQLFSLERFCVDVVEAQRAIAKDSKDTALGAVGGFIQLTSVGPTQITTRIIHRWPDKIDDHFFHS